MITIENENTNGIKGLCLEPHDMAIAKLVAGRDKDLKVCSVLFQNKMLDKSTLLERLEQTEIDDIVSSNVKKNIRILTSEPDNK